MKILSEAREIQKSLAARVRITRLARDVKYVAGVDAAFCGDNVIGSACLFTYPALEKIDEAAFTQKTDFPYIPGFLSFRESPGHMIDIDGAVELVSAYLGRFRLPEPVRCAHNAAALYKLNGAA